jgi:hypothetical protein
MVSCFRGRKIQIRSPASDAAAFISPTSCFNDPEQMHYAIRHPTIARNRIRLVSPDRQLEQLMKILIERFGPARTLGEVYATTYGLHAYRAGRSLTLADIAENTGISKQNLSRWLKAHIETDHVVMQPHQDDGRSHTIEISDLRYACRHLDAIAEVFDCPVAPARTRF